MEMIVRMDEMDFEKLTENSAHWGEWAKNKADRWEHATEEYDTEPSWDWSYAYWVGEDWSRVILCRSFLESGGWGYSHPYEIVWDMAEHPNGQFLGYVILTNYASPIWQSAKKIKEND